MSELRWPRLEDDRAHAPTREPLYRRSDGDEVVPTALAAGPEWLPGTQHGSAVTALLARAVETAGEPSPVGYDGLWEAHDARWQDVTPGGGTVWMRPSNPIVEGEPLTPILRVAMIADLAMSGGGLLATRDYVVVNPDLTLAVVRPPVGDWIALRSRVRIGADGTGQSEAALLDEHGWIGRVLKSLLVERRPPT